MDLFTISLFHFSNPLISLIPSTLQWSNKGLSVKLEQRSSETQYNSNIDHMDHFKIDNGFLPS